VVRLLVSVRNAQEAIDAVEGGANLIDIKEPSRGSLGRADPLVASEIASNVGTRAPLSAAMGELMMAGQEFPPLDLRYAKWGLSGCAKNPAWPAILAERIATVRHANPRCAAVGVVYGDWNRAWAPEPFEVCEGTSRAGCSLLLIDTFLKDGTNLLDWLDPIRLLEIREWCHSHGMQLALAGGIDLRLLPQVLEFEPDWIAVRGAACSDGREGRVSSDRVRQLALLVLEREANPSASHQR
jgi:(5-formylfuran-3-yl)methyl phosphate synthase